MRCSNTSRSCGAGEQDRVRTGVVLAAAAWISDAKRLTTSASSSQLEPLKGDRKGQYSVRISKQWRICFRWRDGHAFDVEIVDYH
jgi:proteic killer suppression protein